MKFIKFVFFLAACSLSMNYARAQTAHSYSSGETPYSSGRKDFCAEDAKERFSHLNEITKSDVAEIEELKKNIREFDAKKKIIEDLKNIRNDYLNTVESISSDTVSKNIKMESVAKFKNLLRNAMTLNAISLLVKNNNFSKSNIISPLEMLCAPNSANSMLALCKTYNPKNLFPFVAWSRSTETNAIDKTLLNFSTSMKLASADESMSVEIGKIYESIPQNLDPQVILEMSVKAPTLTELVLNAKSKTDVSNCLNNNNNSCENLISNPADRENLNAILGKEGSLFQSNISKEYAQVKGQINNKNSEELAKILSSYDDPATANEENNRTIINNKTNKVLAYSENLFKKEHPNADASVTPNAFPAINFSDEEYNKFKSTCLLDSALKGKELKSAILACKSHVETLVAKLEYEKNKISEQTDKLKAKLNQLLNNNPKLEKIEKLKQYIAQRYLRDCPQARESDIALLTSNVLTIKCDNADKGRLDIGNMQDLSNSFAKILGRIQVGNNITKTKGDNGAFSKPEMAIYNDYCRDNNPDATIIETCKDIRVEHDRLSGLRDTKDWDEFNQKYWVENSKTNKVGYDVYEKKSNARIFGEGLSQSINKIYPIWFGNFQLNSQIDSMTNQALYMKQMNYMNNPTSPWMLNNPYFQGNYFGTAGAFTGFGATTMPTTNGFNFSK
ncbi:MAG: hypothetical protein H7281_18325 [Bacteriovorax sp.]|nr:hypothetical protein [Bacteriovorax sp.]